MTTAYRRVADRLESPQLFRDWLASQIGAGSIGRPQSPCGCPIANYLRATESVDCSVGPSSIFTGKDDARICPTPNWATRFIRRLDSKFPAGKELSAADGLAVMLETLQG